MHFVMPQMGIYPSSKILQTTTTVITITTFVLMTIFQLNMGQFPLGFLPLLVLEQNLLGQVAQVFTNWRLFSHTVS